MSAPQSPLEAAVWALTVQKPCRHIVGQSCNDCLRRDARAALTAAIEALPRTEFMKYGPCARFGSKPLDGNEFYVPTDYVRRALLGDK